jgi:ATP phosphoribosyltransferase regulatory subunit HisZ
MEDFDFSAIAQTGLTIEEVAEAMRLLNLALNSPCVITAPDGISVSDTEYYKAFVFNCYSMDEDKPIAFGKLIDYEQT